MTDALKADAEASAARYEAAKKITKTLGQLPGPDDAAKVLKHVAVEFDLIVTEKPKDGA